jgi:hypothetical protein
MNDMPCIHTRVLHALRAGQNNPAKTSIPDLRPPYVLGAGLNDEANGCATDAADDLGCANGCDDLGCANGCDDLGCAIAFCAKQKVDSAYAMHFPKQELTVLFIHLQHEKYCLPSPTFSAAPRGAAP